MLEFDRKYVLLPVLLGVAYVVGAYLLSEAGRDARIVGVASLQRSQERNRLLAELQLTVTDAESAQRGLLLTGDEAYLEPYKQSKQQAEQLLEQLRAAYDTSEAPMQKKALDLSSTITTKFAELDATLALYEKGRSQAMALVRTDFGQRAMEEVRELTRAIRREESDLVRTKTAEWLHAQEVTRAVTAVGSLLNIILIIAAGALVTRDLRRRAAIAADLSSQVAKATTELSELSTYLQRVSEREKSNLARELHDELGGLLIAIKMDLAQLKSQIDLDKPEVKTRWERIQSTLSAGIDLKRRVIEQLRPSLLDNMGLVAALQWQASEVCSRAGLKLIEHYPESVPSLSADASIAIFRIAQEALTNIVKHARAAAVEITLAWQNERLTLCIDDDGAGIAAGRLEAATGAHGIAGMRHRLKSYHGDFKIEGRQPHGTRVVVNLPQDFIVSAKRNRALRKASLTTQDKQNPGQEPRTSRT